MKQISFRTRFRVYCNIHITMGHPTCISPYYIQYQVRVLGSKLPPDVIALVNSEYLRTSDYFGGLVRCHHFQA